MPYADLDLEAGRKNGTVWVRLPNRHFDPRKGHRLYNRYLDELEYAEQLGFDAVSVNEHHQTAYGLMPSPIVTASALARRTKRVRIAILGSALPLREHPLMVAEEHAMIDVISGGRLISGFVRGIGAEYHSIASASTRPSRTSASTRRTTSSCAPGPSRGRSRSRASTTTSST